MHARIARGHLVKRNRCQSTAETPLLFVWNARTHCQGPPCVEKLSSVDCRDDPVICVERTHALPGTALVEKSLSVDCRGDPVICVERKHALPGTALCREIVVAEATLLFVWNARTHCQGPPCVEKSLSVDCYLCETHARIA